MVNKRVLKKLGAVRFVAAIAVLSGTSVVAQTATYQVGTITKVSKGCAGAEVEQEVDAKNGNYVYEEWMGCGGIGFARSTDGGATFSAPITLPGSGGSWDPSLAVAPDGTVYAAYMTSSSTQNYPIVAASFDHGLTFPQVTSLIPPQQNNWGDRIFLATGPDGSVYASWDYGPSIAYLQLICAPNGSCSFSAGELNAVVQKSTDGGKTFERMVHVSPNFPGGGADSAPMVVEPNGKVDLYYQADRTLNHKNYALAPGWGHFSSSVDGGQVWSKPLNVTHKSGTQSLGEWWIDGAIGRDAAGNLYATWDTQGKNADGTPNDIGWIAYSTDGGTIWSATIQATPDKLNVPHIIEVAGGGDGVAYVAWLSNSDPRGYAMYLRAYSIKSGWLSAPFRVSTAFGNGSVWPGDTFGISAFSSNSLVLSWGGAVAPSKNSAIYAVPVTVQF